MLSTAALADLPVFSLNGGRHWFYFVPALEEYCLRRFNANFTLLKAKDLERRSTKRAQQFRRSNPAEPARRTVRAKIVECAAALWTGHLPVAWQGVVDITNASIRGDITNFRNFEARFAPVDKIATFLFPAYRLSAESDANALSTEYYLPDPTEGWTAGQAHAVSDFGCALLALNMLRQLVDVSNWNRHNWQVGHGRYVTPWINAAKEYHKLRLLSHITTRLPYTILPDPNAVQLRYGQQLIRHLRIGIGLCFANDRAPPPLPNRPSVHANMDAATYLALDRFAIQATRRREEHLKLFDTIMRAYCAKCPISGRMVGPGVDNIVEHVFERYRDNFWLDDNWVLQG